MKKAASILGGGAGTFDGDAGGFHAHGGGGFTQPVGIAAFFDPGTFLDPFVGCIHVFLQVIIGIYVLRNIKTDPGNLASLHAIVGFEEAIYKIADNATVSDATKPV